MRSHDSSVKHQHLSHTPRPLLLGDGVFHRAPRTPQAPQLACVGPGAEALVVLVVLLGQRRGGALAQCLAEDHTRAPPRLPLWSLSPPPQASPCPATLPSLRGASFMEPRGTYPVHGDDSPLPVSLLQGLGVQLKERSYS